LKDFAIIIYNLMEHILAQKLKKVRQKEKMLPIALLDKRIQVIHFYWSNENVLTDIYTFKRT